MSKFHVGSGLNLPPTSVTETFGALGKRGSGKTNFMRVMAEEMLGYFNNTLGALRTLKLISGYDTLQVSDIFFQG